MKEYLTREELKDLFFALAVGATIVFIISACTGFHYGVVFSFLFASIFCIIGTAL